MKILFLSRWFPYPPDNGSKIRIYHLIQSLTKGHSVDLVSFSSKQVESSQRRMMESICRTVDTFDYRLYQPTRITALVGFFSRYPRFLVDTYHPGLAAAVKNKCKNEHYDLIIFSQLDMVPYIKGIEGPAILFEELEISRYIDSLNNQASLAASLWARMTWWKLSAFLESMLSNVNGCTTVSENESQKIKTNLKIHPPIQVIPNCVDLDHAGTTDILPKPDTLIYSGSLTYRPNYEAVDYFLRHIFPLIQKKRPSVTLTVTGSLEGVDLSQLPQTKGVIFTGYLENIAAAVAGSWAAVVPLREGGGTRLKILEALSFGTPVISTSKGAEGLDLIPGCDLLIGDDPHSFAGQVLRVLEDEPLRMKLAQAGRQSIEQKYDWRKVGEAFRIYAENVAFKRTVAPER